MQWNDICDAMLQSLSLLTVKRNTSKDESHVMHFVQWQIMISADVRFIKIGLSTRAKCHMWNSYGNIHVLNYMSNSHEFHWKNFFHMNYIHNFFHVNSAHIFCCEFHMKMNSYDIHFKKHDYPVLNVNFTNCDFACIYIKVYRYWME